TALEVLHRVDTIVFDKTGTLTVGRPEVTDIVTVPGVGEDDALAVAAGAEQASEHPLGEAIVRLAKERGLALPPVGEFTAVPGQGIDAMAPDGRILLGNETMMNERGIDVSRLADRAIALQAQGKTVVVLAFAGRLLALIAVAIEAADVTLMRGDVAGVVVALELSRRTIQIVKQNLGWAFGYNILLIPVAAGVLYPLAGVLLSPILAGAAMAFSSVSVVTNSLRLKRWRPA